MKNEMQKLMDDVFRLYGDINQKVGPLDRLAQINHLYQELQSQLEGVSAEELERIETQIKATLEQLLTFSESMQVVKNLKLAIDGHNDNHDPTKPQPIKKD